MMFLKSVHWFSFCLWFLWIEMGLLEYLISSSYLSASFCSSICEVIIWFIYLDIYNSYVFIIHLLFYDLEIYVISGPAPCIIFFAWSHYARVHVFILFFTCCISLLSSFNSNISAMNAIYISKKYLHIHTF